MLFHSALVTFAAAADKAYNYTIDCSSFNRPAGWTAPSTCALEGDWSKIIGRQLPEWYADMKLGIFIHWGVYSVPSYGSEWYWHTVECASTAKQPFASSRESPRAFQDRVYGKDWKYPSFANMFKAELFDAAAWAKTFKGAGAQYVLPVAKHHDGFCMWNATTVSPGWNAVELGPKRDVYAAPSPDALALRSLIVCMWQRGRLKELYDATQAVGLDWGIYFSQGEWFDADMVQDHKNNYTTNAFFAKMAAQRRELVAKFPKAMLWHTDGGWAAPDAYWGNLQWLTWLYEESPLKERIATCNSLGFNCCQKYPGHGDTCWEYGDAPSGGDRTTAGQVVPHFYTNQMTIQRGSWLWDRSEPLSQMLSAKDLVTELVQTTAWNGTLVVNVGPTADGRLAPIFEERLAALGGWLALNGEAIYGTRPWLDALPTGAEPPSTNQTKPSVFYTTGKAGRVFAIVLVWPADGTLSLTRPTPSAATTVALLATGAPLRWTGCAAPCSMSIVLGPQPGGDSGLAWAVALDGLK